MEQMMHTWVFFLQLALLLKEIEMVVEVKVGPPHGCICPHQNYTCRADNVEEMSWSSDSLEDSISYSIHRSSSRTTVNTDSFRVQFSEVTVDGGANLTSYIFIIDILRLNGSNITCEAFLDSSNDRDTVTICVMGSASAPTDLSVVCDSSSAVVSFHPPLYGGECVDYYVVTAVSEERNVACHATSEQLTYNCSIPQGSNVNEYNFTAYSVTRGIDGVTYEGGIANNCSCIPLPENVRAVEVECGLQHLVYVSWQNSHLASVMTSIIVHSSEDLHYDDITSSEESHLLILNYSVTGLLEISVTFSSHVCSKTIVTQYHARGVLTSVSVSGTTLIIQSRDCIASPENYRIVATFTDTSTELVNVFFTSIIEHDVGDEVMPDTQYSITVVLVETTSNTVIDERTTSFTTPSQPPSRGTTTDNMTDCACAQMNEENEKVIVTSVSVGVCGVLLGVVLGTVVTVTVFTVMRNKNTVGGHKDLSTGQDTELSAVNVVHQSETTAVVYDTPSDVVAGTGPDTSENVAYGVNKRVLTTPNPAYDVAQI